MASASRSMCFKERKAKRSEEIFTGGWKLCGREQTISTYSCEVALRGCTQVGEKRCREGEEKETLGRGGGGGGEKGEMQQGDSDG